MNDQNDIKFKVGDPVLVLLVAQPSLAHPWLGHANEYVEEAVVASIQDDRAVVRLVNREGQPLMPLHRKYILHCCSWCSGPCTVKGEVCHWCGDDDTYLGRWDFREWDDAQVGAEAFRATSPYLRLFWRGPARMWRVRARGREPQHYTTSYDQIEGLAS